MNFRPISLRARQGAYLPLASTSQKALETATADARLSEDEIRVVLRNAGGIAIPARVHRRHSETYSGRNTKTKQALDASNLEAAVDSSFNAIKRGLVEEGFSEADIEQARKQLHLFNKQKGWY